MGRYREGRVKKKQTEEEPDWGEVVAAIACKTGYKISYIKTLTMREVQMLLSHIGKTTDEKRIFQASLFGYDIEGKKTSKYQEPSKLKQSHKDMIKASLRQRFGDKLKEDQLAKI